MIYKFTNASTMASDIQRAKSDGRAFIIKKENDKWYVQIPKIYDGNSFDLGKDSDMSLIGMGDIKENDLIKTDGAYVSSITQENYYPYNVDSKLHNHVDSAIYKLATYGKNSGMIDSGMKIMASINESSGISLNVIKNYLRTGKNIKIYPRDDFNASTKALIYPKVDDSEPINNRHQFKGLNKRTTSSPLLSLLSRSKAYGSFVDKFFNHTGNTKYNDSSINWTNWNTVKWNTTNSYI